MPPIRTAANAAARAILLITGVDDPWASVLRAGLRGALTYLRLVFEQSK